MIGLDSNILVRYFVQDDPVQSRRAAEILERELTDSDPGFVSLVAIAETAWVLGRVYDFTDGEIAAAIERVMQTDRLVVQSEQEVFTATVALRDGRGSFGDALIAAMGARAGCSHTLTFDRAALRLPGFRSAGA